MLFSGIHFNFSFSEACLRALNPQNEDPNRFRDALYLRLYKQLMRHSWLLVMLTAASPYYDASRDQSGERGIIKSPYAFMRNSVRGYWNQSLPDFDFTPDLQMQAVSAHQNAALLEPDAALTEQADEILHKMEVYFSEYEDARNVIAFEKNKRYQPQTYSNACCCISR